MVDKKDLRGNLIKMRDVAGLLNAWADDMEKALSDSGAGSAGSSAGAVASVGGSSPSSSSSGSSAVVASAPPSGIPVPQTLDFPSVREYLGKMSAAGYKTQVQALVNSFGAVKLSGLDPSCFPALVEAVSALGGDDCAG